MTAIDRFSAGMHVVTPCIYITQWPNSIKNFHTAPNNFRSNYNCLASATSYSVKLISQFHLSRSTFTSLHFTVHFIFPCHNSISTKSHFLCCAIHQVQLVTCCVLLRPQWPLQHWRHTHVSPFDVNNCRIFSPVKFNVQLACYHGPYCVQHDGKS